MKKFSLFPVDQVIPEGPPNCLLLRARLFSPSGRTMICRVHRSINYYVEPGNLNFFININTFSSHNLKVYLEFNDQLMSKSDLQH